MYYARACSIRERTDGTPAIAGNEKLSCIPELNSELYTRSGLAYTSTQATPACGQTEVACKSDRRRSANCADGLTTSHPASTGVLDGYPDHLRRGRAWQCILETADGVDAARHAPMRDGVQHGKESAEGSALRSPNAPLT